MRGRGVAPCRQDVYPMCAFVAHPLEGRPAERVANRAAGGPGRARLFAAGLGERANFAREGDLCGPTDGVIAVANESRGPGARGKGMSVREAGKMGGEARKTQLGPQGYSQMGKKGGETVARER